jgi:hypothetical protein
MRLAQSSFFLFLSVDEESFHPSHDGSHLDPDKRSVRIEGRGASSRGEAGQRR